MIITYMRFGPKYSNRILFPKTCSLSDIFEIYLAQESLANSSIIRPVERHHLRLHRYRARTTRLTFSYDPVSNKSESRHVRCLFSFVQSEAEVVKIS